MFGDWGALLVQFAVTAGVILGLIALVYWLVRRYSAAGLGRLGRGRVPRLAIVDAMSVDARRRLVLVRRDNVEHLLLIGGPSDVVVEQAIQRLRRPKAAAATTEIDAVLQQAPAEEGRSAAHSPPIPPLQSRSYASLTQNGARNGDTETDRPFSFRRSAPALPPVHAASATRQPAETGTPPSSTRFVDVQRPTRIEAASAALASQPEDIEPLFPDLPTADLPMLDDEPSPPPAQNGADARQVHSDGATRSGPVEKSPYAKPDSNSSDSGGKLADLENEMARLLGEITQKRHP